MHQKIRISADSTCDLSPKLIEEYNVTILPLSIVIDGKEYKDGVEIQPAELFASVEATGVIPKTTAINTDEYYREFCKLKETCDAVIHINISSEFSSCYQNACLAAKELENVYVVDSRNLSTGSGLIVCEAAKLIQEGLEASEIYRTLCALTEKVEASFVLSSLEYLRTGGRCSALAAFGASILYMKPCIEVKDGKMGVGKKYMGSYAKSVLRYVKDRLKDRDDLRLDRIFLTYTVGSDPELIQSVREEISSYAQFERVDETTANCTISSHCGPNTLGILFLRK